MNETENLLYKRFLYALKFVKVNNFENLKEKYNIKIWEESKCKTIRIIWEKIKSDSETVFLNVNNVDISDDDQKSYIEPIVKRARLLGFIDDSINSINEKVDLETSTDSGWNLEPHELDFDSLYLYFQDFSISLSSLAALLPEIKSKNNQ